MATYRSKTYKGDGGKSSNKPKSGNRYGTPNFNPGAGAKNVQYKDSTGKIRTGVKLSTGEILAPGESSTQRQIYIQPKAQTAQEAYADSKEKQYLSKESEGKTARDTVSRLTYTKRIESVEDVVEAEKQRLEATYGPKYEEGTRYTKEQIAVRNLTKEVIPVEVTEKDKYPSYTGPRPGKGDPFGIEAYKKATPDYTERNKAGYVITAAAGQTVYGGEKQYEALKGGLGAARTPYGGGMGGEYTPEAAVRLGGESIQAKIAGKARSPYAGMIELKEVTPTVEVQKMPDKEMPEQPKMKVGGFGLFGLGGSLLAAAEPKVIGETDNKIITETAQINLTPTTPIIQTGVLAPGYYLTQQTTTPTTTSASMVTPTSSAKVNEIIFAPTSWWVAGGIAEDYLGYAAPKSFAKGLTVKGVTGLATNVFTPTGLYRIGTGAIKGLAGAAAYAATQYLIEPVAETYFEGVEAVASKVEQVSVPTAKTIRVMKAGPLGAAAYVARETVWDTGLLVKGVSEEDRNILRQQRTETFLKRGGGLEQVSKTTAKEVAGLYVGGVAMQVTGKGFGYVENLVYEPGVTLKTSTTKKVDAEKILGVKKGASQAEIKKAAIELGKRGSLQTPEQIQAYKQLTTKTQPQVSVDVGGRLRTPKEMAGILRSDMGRVTSKINSGVTKASTALMKTSTSLTQPIKAVAFTTAGKLQTIKGELTVRSGEIVKYGKTKALTVRDKLVEYTHKLPTTYNKVSVREPTALTKKGGSLQTVKGELTIRKGGELTIRKGELITRKGELVKKGTTDITTRKTEPKIEIKKIGGTIDSGLPLPGGGLPLLPIGFGGFGRGSRRIKSFYEGSVSNPFANADEALMLGTGFKRKNGKRKKKR